MGEESGGDELELHRDKDKSPRPPVSPPNQPDDREHKEAGYLLPAPPGGLLPVPMEDDERRGGQLAVPSDNQLRLMLHQAEDGEGLIELQKAAATLLHATERQDKLKHRLFEVAVFNLEVQRKLGSLLLQTDARGGDRAKCHADILLSANLEPSAATRYRKIARVQQVYFAQYVERQRLRSEIPSAAGCLRFPAQGAAGKANPKKARKNRRSASGEIQVSPKVLDAIARCLGDIDVCVGGAKVKCRLRVTGASLTVQDLQGTVLVSARVDPGVWLETIVELKNSGRCQQVVLILSAEFGADWLRCFLGASWHLCFLAAADEPVVVAFIGQRTEGFFAAMHDHGLVVSVHA